LLAALTILIVHTVQRLPENWKPWGHVRLDRKPTSFANWQINILAFAPKTCLAALTRANVAYTPVAYRPMIDGCGLSDGVHVAKLTARFSEPIESTCALAAALAWWEEVVDKDAMAALGAHIARVDHVGTYACRDVKGSLIGWRSEHATANAIDVTAFRLSDGRTVSVARDWGKPTPEGRFLALARGEACRFFNAVLSPDYNALHHDHFHLDLGLWRACR